MRFGISEMFSTGANMIAAVTSIPAGDGVIVRAPWKAHHGCWHGILTIMKGIDNAPSKS
jgi:hypothetical protein